MAVYEDFLEYVAPAVPGASEPLMVRAIRDACVDFCVETGFFRKTLEPIPSVAGIAEYEIETPEGTVVSNVRGAWYDGVRIGDVANEDTDQKAQSVEYGVTAVPGTPTKLVYTSGNTFLLDPVPADSAKDVVLAVTLKPTRASTEVWDQLFEDFAEVIAAGALAKLMDIKGQVFYDPAEGARKGREFMVGKNAARVRSDHGGLGSKKLFVRARRI